MSGLRVRKKAQTAQAIVDAAMALLVGRHFAAVTIEDISAAVGISRRTFFRYFPTKEDVLLDRRRLDHASIQESAARRMPGEDDVALLMRLLADLQGRVFAPFRPEHQLELHRLTHDEPELAARSWLLMEQVRDRLVAGLVGPRPERAAMLRARLLASACVMAVDVGVTTWIEGGLEEDLGVILAEGAEHLRRGFASSGGHG
jgi:AcrR family transcriptional regulator